MTKAHLLLGALVLAGSAVLGSQANAKPVSIGYSLNGGATVTTIATDSGSVAGATKAGGFTITLTAIGTPPDIDPNFSSASTTVTASSAGTIYLYATETNNTAIVPSFSIGFSNNPKSIYSVTESFYASNTNKAYALDVLLAQETLAPGVTKTDYASFGSLAAPYSVTEVYKITFTDGGTSRVDATIIETAVPEPVSMSLLGAGLVGMGMVRMRRKS